MTLLWGDMHVAGVVRRTIWWSLVSFIFIFGSPLFAERELVNVVGHDLVLDVSEISNGHFIASFSKPTKGKDPKKIESLVIENPDRLVLDFFGLSNGGFPIKKEVDSTILKSIRVGRHADKTRFVFDLGSKAGLKIDNQSRGQGQNLLSISFSVQTAGTNQGAKLPELNDPEQIASPTPTGTVALTPTPSPTEIPTATPTPVPTVAPTQRPTPTAKPTVTMTATPTNTPIPTATIQPTMTPAPTSTSTPTPTVTPTPTATATAVPTVIVTSAPTPTVSPAMVIDSEDDNPKSPIENPLDSDPEKQTPQEEDGGQKEGAIAALSEVANQKTDRGTDAPRDIKEAENITKEELVGDRYEDLSKQEIDPKLEAELLKEPSDMVDAVTAKNGKIEVDKIEKKPSVSIVPKSDGPLYSSELSAYSLKTPKSLEPKPKDDSGIEPLEEVEGEFHPPAPVKLAPPDAKIQSFDPVDDWALDIETKDNSEPLLRKSTLDLALILTIVSFIIFVFFTFRKLRAMQRAGVYVSHPGDLTGPDPVVQAYQVLGLSPGATIDEVKQNYRKLAKKFHHDRLTSDKIPDEVKALAGQEFQKIQHAYEVLKIELGFS